MTITLDLDVSRMVLCAAGAVSRRESRVRGAVSRFLLEPRGAAAQREIRACLDESAERAQRSDLELLRAVAQTGGAGVGLGGSPRTPSLEEESC